MKLVTHVIIGCVFASIIVSCSSDKTKEEKMEEVEELVEEAKKDVSQLTYRDIVKLVFNDEGQGIEWHGEAVSNSLQEMLSMTNEGSCGDDSCGKEMFLINNDTIAIEVIVKGAFDIEGDRGHIARKYMVKPGETVSMGCSHLCYDGKAYLFDRSIVGSSYVE